MTQSTYFGRCPLTLLLALATFFCSGACEQTSKHVDDNQELNSHSNDWRRLISPDRLIAIPAYVPSGRRKLRNGLRWLNDGDFIGTKSAILNRFNRPSINLPTPSDHSSESTKQSNAVEQHQQSQHPQQIVGLNQPANVQSFQPPLEMKDVSFETNAKSYWSPVSNIADSYSDQQLKRKRNPEPDAESSSTNSAVGKSEQAGSSSSSGLGSAAQNHLKTLMARRQLFQRRAAALAAAAAAAAETGGNDPTISLQSMQKHRQQQPQSQLPSSSSSSSSSSSHHHPHHSDGQQQLNLNLAKALSNYRNTYQTNQQQQLETINAMRHGDWRKIAKTVAVRNDLGNCIHKCMMQKVLHPTLCHSLC